MRPRPTARAAVALLASLSALALPAHGQEISNPDLFGKSLEVAEKALELYGRVDDPEAADRVAAVGYRVAQAANFTGFPFTFHLVDMPEPNAFALPGGHIFVTQGMLRLGLDDDMLAALLGHEIGHVVKEHGVKMQRRQALMQVLSQALTIGVLVSASQQGRRRDRDGIQAPYDPRVGEDDPGAAMVQGTVATSLIVSELLLRGYSRDFEREADDEGQRFAVGAGYAPAGMRGLMALMEARLPQSKAYGYWQTHPFFDERVRGAETRVGILVAQPARSTDEYRQRTQAALLAYTSTPKLPAEQVKLLQADAMTAWPRGPQIEEIRLANLHELRDPELKLTTVSRDYGKLLAAYRKEIAEVERVDPASGLVPKLRDELASLDGERTAAYQQAAAVVAGGIYETSFLEKFESNFPTAAEVPRVALALGDAYSRLGSQAKAVEQYLKAWETVPASDEGKRARLGLRNLAPVLDSLTALEQLARQSEDHELARLAADRLAAIAGSFSELANGAEYLRRFPDAGHAETVTARLNSLADKLYTEVVLYQGLGDSVKALDRINKILTHAPASPAAAQIRDRAVVEST